MDIHFIRKNTNSIKDNQKKRFKNPDDIDEIIKLDREWIKLDFHINQLRKLKNEISKSFRNAATNMTIQLDEPTFDDFIKDINDKKQELTILTKQQLAELAGYAKKSLETQSLCASVALKKRDDMIKEVGNMLHKNVPIDDDETNNHIIKKVDHKIGSLTDKPLSHIDLIDKLGFADTKNGVKIAGNRGYFFTGMGVKFNRAVVNYALDFLESKKYKLMYTPFFVTEDLMSKISQLTDYQETLYKVDDKYLIATSEQPLTAYFHNKTFDNDQLPIKFGGISTCFRKETGSHGRNTNGIYRVHQFEKVEQFCVTRPDKSWDMLEEMIGLSQEFYDSLGISYRVVNIVSAALNNAAAMKYDLEAWFPGSKDYCELVSCTNCTDYFSNRLKTKLNDNTSKFVHMLNCTLCANTRTICAIVETYQTMDGIIVPDVLKPYLGGIKEIKFIN